MSCGDKNYIYWTMAEIDNPPDIIGALKQYQKLENTYCNTIDTNKCNIDSWDVRIVFELNGNMK